MYPQPGSRARITLGIASIGVALAAADTYVVVIALTDMMTDVGVTIDALQKATPIISGFLLGYIAVLPLIGRITDLVARQKVLQLCFATFILGSVVTALATDLPVLVGGRVLQGVGGGGLLPATLALVADIWSEDRRGTALGVVGGVQELGSVLGPVLGAAILAVTSWRGIFWFNALVGLLLSAILFVLMKRSDKRRWAERRPRVRLPAIVLCLGIALLVLALWAPTFLVRSVVFGAPFVPLGATQSPLLTPIGLLALIVVCMGLAVMLRSAGPTLRQADLLGALLLGGSISCVILTFATANPESEVVGPLGLVLLPVALLLGALFLLRNSAPRNR